MENQVDQARSTKAVPTDLQGLTIPQPDEITPDTARQQSTKEPEVSVDKKDGGNTASFATLVHGYTWSAITFAEQKSGFIFAIDSAFIGYLASSGLLRNLLVIEPSSWRTAESLGAAALLLLGMSMGVILWAVIPRLGGSPTGLIFFNSIALRRDPAAYVSDVTRLTDDERTSAVLEHCYEVAKICGRKYLAIRVAIICAIPGFVAGLSYIAIS